MDGSEQVWRVSPAGRIAGVLLAVGWVVLAAVVSASGNPAAIVIWLGGALIAVGVWRWAFVPYIAAGPSQVVVQNRLSKTTVDYSQIGRVRTGYYGVTMILKDGRSVSAWAVQKSNWARWRHSPTRADEVAQVIIHHVESAQTQRP